MEPTQQPAAPFVARYKTPTEDCIGRPVDIFNTAESARAKNQATDGGRESCGSQSQAMARIPVCCVCARGELAGEASSCAGHFMSSACEEGGFPALQHVVELGRVGNA